MKTGLGTLDLLVFAWLAFAWFWDFPEDGPLYGRLRKMVRPLIEFTGMGHSWKLYADGEWKYFHSLVVRLHFADGRHFDRKFKGVSEILWSWNVLKEQSHLRNTLLYYLNRNPEAISADIIFLTQLPKDAATGLLDCMPLPDPTQWKENVLLSVKASEEPHL